MKLEDWLFKVKTKNIFIFNIFIIGVIGNINILINSSKVKLTINGSIFKILATVAANFVVAFVVQLSYILVLSLTLYFAAALINKGFEIKTFVRLSIRAMIFASWLNITDLIGFLFFGKRIVSFGAIGLLSFIPFYISVIYLLIKLFPKYIDLSKKQKIIISIIGGIITIFVTYPYLN
jgi:hypothetical protein